MPLCCNTTVNAPFRLPATVDHASDLLPGQGLLRWYHVTERDLCTPQTAFRVRRRCGPSRVLMEA
jgi:hypothetical protein